MSIERNKKWRVRQRWFFQIKSWIAVVERPPANGPFEILDKSIEALIERLSKVLDKEGVVIGNKPDNGFSRKGDGSDLPAAWSGQTPLETFYLSSLFPAAPELAKGLLKNFLSTQSADGFIDHRLGIAGQRSRLLAMPILASLAWQLYQSTEDETFLNEVFPKLIKFFWAWFSPERDADRDGIPQWRHVLQTGFEDNPLFDTWHPWSQGADITKVHSPALVSMLYREASCLIQMAEHLNQVSELNTLHAQAALLRNIAATATNAGDKTTKSENELIPFQKNIINITPIKTIEVPISGSIRINKTGVKPIASVIRISLNESMFELFLLR